MVSRRDAEALRREFGLVGELLVRDLTGFFGSLNLRKPEAARDSLLEFVPLLVAQYGEVAATIAADWYDDMRAAERVRGTFRATIFVPDETFATEQTVRRAAGSLFTDAPVEALPTIAGKATKYALSGGRMTVARSTVADPQASGWKRVTSAGACRFCRMLAGRGGVYKESTAHFAAHGGAKGGDCNCAAVPSWDRRAPEVDVRLYEASKRTSRMTPAQRERHNAQMRSYLEAYDD